MVKFVQNKKMAKIAGADQMGRPKWIKGGYKVIFMFADQTSGSKQTPFISEIDRPVKIP
jgi:hypothetical protein